MPISISYRAQVWPRTFRYPDQWMRDKAEKRIGRLYPKVGCPRSKAAAGHGHRLAVGTAP